MTCIGTVIVQHHDEATRYYCLGVLEARIQIIAQVAKYIFSFACHNASWFGSYTESLQELFLILNALDGRICQIAGHISGIAVYTDSA